MNKVAEYIADRLKNGSLIDKIMLAKWLVKPSLSKRIKTNFKGEVVGKRDIQRETKKLMNTKIKLYEILSTLMNWKVIYYPHNIQFTGLNEFRKRE